MTARLKGLIAPPSGFVSDCRSLLGAHSPAKLLTWDAIRKIAASGKRDGNFIYGTAFHVVQRHNNCAGASASRIVAKSIYDRSNSVVMLSDTYTYSLINGGHDNGSMLADAMQSIERDGVALATTVGPDAIFQRQYDYLRAREEAKRFRAAECYAIRPRDFSSLDDLQRAFWSALAQGFKVGVAVQAGANFDQVKAYGRVPGVDDGPGNHAVHCDGLTSVDGVLYATTENTWPMSLPNGSRIHLRWEHLKQTIGVHEFYAVRSAIDDPQGVNPPEVVT